MKVKLLAAALVLAAMSTKALAAMPDSGWYWNPNESGRGFNIEIQNDTLFIAGFVYDANGKPIWITAGGSMTGTRAFSGAAYTTQDGQPLGGTYKPPQVIPYGTCTITWSTTTDATITINGYAVHVTRQDYGINLADIAIPLLGEFSYIEGSSGLYFGDRLVFTKTAIDGKGLPYAVGHVEGDPLRVAVGSYVPALGLWTILLDSSILYYEYFKLTFTGLNRVDGTASTYLKGSLPGVGLPTTGVRTASAKEAASIKATTAPSLRTDAQMAIRASNEPAARDAADIEVVERLQRLLEEVKK